MIWTVAKKELRGYFTSAVAVSFLLFFLSATFYTFFWTEKFFARGIADLRPLFSWMPLLMILLASALSMQMWAEEKRAGTLEILLTLPVERWRLVIGKFVGGMLLIGIALGLTLGLPVTIAGLGNLDPGPVFGGYLGCLLLAAAYLAIGLCISAATDNAIVAFIGTAFACSILFVLGYGPQPIAQLGSGVRFESVARGVLDLRDLAYYAAIIATGVAVNVLLLSRVSWARGPAAETRRRGMALAVILVAANAIALIVWLSPVRGARIDMTRDGAYSLSEGTERVIAQLDERVLIRGYFSGKTHPLLAPLVPQVADLLDEYAALGDGKVKVELVDPTENDDLKREAKERFGIDPQPLPFETKDERSVINAYFNIAIAYGDQHAVIGLEDLVKVRQTGVENVEVMLNNPEYAITRTIKKVVAEFSSVDALFAGSAGKLELTAYITPDALPENWKEAPAKLTKVVEELKKQSGDKLAFTQVEPKTEAEMKSLFEQYGIRPYSDLFANQAYYFHLLLKVGTRMVRIQPPQNLGEAELKTTILDGLKRAAPGFTRVVGLWQPPSGGQIPSMGGMPPRDLPPPQTFELLSRSLQGSYEVRRVDLASPVSPDIEVLVLAGPANLDPKAAEHVDQFVMSGGALVALAGRYRIAMGNGLAIEKVNTGLEDMFEKWGITLGDEMVLDTKSDSFPIPQNRDLGGGMIVREIAQLPYPFFVKSDGTQLADNLITGALSATVLHWVSPVSAATTVDGDKHTVVNLVKSSDGAWTTTSTDVQPDLRKYPETGFAPPGEDVKRSAKVLAVAVTGGFTSAFAKPADKDKDAKAADGNSADAATSRLIEHSALDSRVVVFGSSAFASDDILRISQQFGPEVAESNLLLVHNAVDWSLADTDLLAIRSRSGAAHAITIPPDQRGKWRYINWIVAKVVLFGLIGLVAFRRRAVRPVVTAREV